MAITINGSGGVTGLTALPDSAMSSGSIIQIQQLFKNDAVSATGSSETSFNDISGMSLAITPSSSSNKIMVCYNVKLSCSTNGRNNCMRLLRGSTVIGGGTGGTTTNAIEHFRQVDGNGNEVYTGNYSFLDSPATTSETTYKLQWSIESGTAYLNRRGEGGGSSTAFGLASTITLYEVAA